jgi:hypothetical protein
MASSSPTRELGHALAEPAAGRAALRALVRLWKQFLSALRTAVLKSGRERAAKEACRHRFLFYRPGEASSRTDSERELTRIRYLISSP